MSSFELLLQYKVAFKRIDNQTAVNVSSSEQTTFVDHNWVKFDSYLLPFKMF